RWLVEELAQEEQEHFDLFTRLMERDDIHAQVQARIATPTADHKFSDHIHLPDLGDNPDDQAVLQYALGREHAAMEQYRELANSTEPGPIHDLFQFLADEETKHKAELEKIYYEIVHSGGV
ncbi:MAG: rubrerythrin, partial [Gammaproteobacteria bacterium]|nr:rubrerythrin [Gammaproteobacteria bacterium]